MLILFGPPPSTGRTLRRKGAAAVEFALVSIAFFTLLLGLVELGRGLMANYLMSNAARQATRAGIIPGTSTAEIIQASTTALANGGIQGATTTVKVNGTSGDASSAQTGDTITVTITIPVSSVSWLPKANYLFGSITSEYTLRRE